MKVSELKLMVENIVLDEVRKTIMEESEGNKEVYHIKCEGVPLGTYNSQEEAENDMDKFKEMHPGKELIIEKGVYESHDDMLDKLDEMNDQLEETNDMENTEMQPEEGNAFSGALAAAKLKGDKEFKVGDKEYDVKEEEECDECGGSYMEEEEENEFSRDLKAAKDAAERGRRYERFPLKSDEDNDEWNMDQLKKDFGNSDDEEKEDDDSYFEEMLRRRRRKYKSVDNEETPDEMAEEKECCEKCGKEMCECGGGMYESKKKKLRLKESELTNLIVKMVNESVPGLDAAKKAHSESGKENKANLAAVEKKIAGILKFDGNDNPEFPKAIGKGEKVARKNTPAQEDEIKKNFAGLENLDYDIEPDEKFKKRLKMALEGDVLMGNAPTTEKTDVKPSNGAKLGEEPKDKDGNVIPTPETAKGIEKQVKDRQKDKDSRELYKKQTVSVTSKSINEEVEKMKKMFKYNEKTQ